MNKELYFGVQYGAQVFRTEDTGSGQPLEQIINLLQWPTTSRSHLIWGKFSHFCDNPNFGHFAPSQGSQSLFAQGDLKCFLCSNLQQQQKKNYKRLSDIPTTCQKCFNLIWWIKIFRFAKSAFFSILYSSILGWFELYIEQCTVVKNHLQASKGKMCEHKFESVLFVQCWSGFFFHSLLGYHICPKC